MWRLDFLSRLRGLAPIVLRLVVGGAFFAFHGLDKVRPDGAWDWGRAFAAKGYASPLLLYVAAWTEFLGGFALVLGLLTRWAAVGILGVMLYAIFKVNAGRPFADLEPAVFYAAACVALAVLGPGSFSLDRLVFGKRALGA